MQVYAQYVKNHANLCKELLLNIPQVKQNSYPFPSPKTFKKKCFPYYLINVYGHGKGVPRCRQTKNRQTNKQALGPTPIQLGFITYPW